MTTVEADWTENNPRPYRFFSGMKALEQCGGTVTRARKRQKAIGKDHQETLAGNAEGSWRLWVHVGELRGESHQRTRKDST